MPSDDKAFYRRRLPHYQPAQSTFFITFRLTGSLAPEVLMELMREQEFTEKQIEKEKDSKKKQRLLRESRKRYFGCFDSYRDHRVYDLFAFCVIPNHIHLVFSPVGRRDSSPYIVTKILENLKLERIIQYVAYNPVNAGLCKHWQDWKWTHVMEPFVKSLT